MNKSVIIIGGGLGGLMSGAILAKEGLKVTIIEKNAIIGGGLQSFRRFGEVFDTGMHIIGGMQKDGNVRRICEYLGIWDRLHIMDVDAETTDTIFFSEDRKCFRIAQGRHKFIDSLSERFPEERENLIAYVDAMYSIADEVDLFYLRPSSDYMQVHSTDFHMSANGFIAKYLNEEHLRCIVAYMNPLYGGRGDITPAYIHALISVLYIDGPSRFAGGSLLFAETLRDFIIENGGHVFSGDPVTAIHSEEKNISGVTTSSGQTFSADYYISAIHPCSLFPLLDDQKILPKPYRNRLNELPNAYSAFTLNIKLKPGTFRFCNYTRYYMSHYDRVWKFGDSDLVWPCGFLFVTPPEINQGEYSTKLIVTAPMQWRLVRQWEDTTVGNRGRDYELWKEECTQRLLNCMQEMFPDFRECIQEINSASPLTIRDFYGVKEGSMCGFSKDCNNLVLSQVPVVTKVPNLFLTGQNCNLHGFCGVSLTAINTCEAILGYNEIIKKINRFADLRPYIESEISGAMHRLAGSPEFEKYSEIYFPGENVENIRKKVETVDTVSDFQHNIMLPAVRRIIADKNMDLSYDGIEKLDRSKSFLFLCDGMNGIMDSVLLSYVLSANGYDTPEIAFNFKDIEGEFLLDLCKSNKLFNAECLFDRIPGDEDSAVHLSEYIRSTIFQKQQSVVIRSWGGDGHTDPGIMRMLAMGGEGDAAAAIAELRVVPVSVSCESNGRVHLYFCNQIDRAEFEALRDSNDFSEQVAGFIDQRINKS